MRTRSIASVLLVLSPVACLPPGDPTRDDLELPPGGDTLGLDSGTAAEPDTDSDADADTDTDTDTDVDVVDSPWQRTGSPVLDRGEAGAWDERFSAEPTVVFHDGQFWMWYVGDNHSSYPGHFGIGLATSSDGETWTRHPSNPVLTMSDSGWDDVRVNQPQVLWDGDQFRMWYSGQDGTCWRVGTATSPDGTTWTKDLANPVLDLGASGSWDDRHVGAAAVIQTEGGFAMLYTGTRHEGGGYNDIGLATSEDGVSWTRHPDNPVLARSTDGGWDSASAMCPSVIHHGGRHHI